MNISLKNKKRFNNDIGLGDSEYGGPTESEHSWETDQFGWFPIDSPPPNIHAGLAFALGHIK